MRTLTFHQVLGVGAMGTVYRAALRDSQGTRDCAVKVIKTSHPDQEQFRGRMRDEARLLGMLRDEQILGVSELVLVEGHDGVVMEYVEGVDLAELLGCAPEKGTPRITMPPRALAELAADLAGTLHRAHSARNPTTGEPLRVIHRDLKPANVMVTSSGDVRLLDFGVARAAFESRESQTQGLVLGTLNYFPPEILAGSEPTPAVDLYGLGLSVWECASGADWGPPQVHRHRFERRVEQRLADLAPEYEPLMATIRRLLAWRPQDRPDGAAAERLFGQVVEACGGPSLVEWAAAVVPPRLAARASPPDDWVGRTLTLEGGEVVRPAVPSTPPPRPADRGGARDGVARPRRRPSAAAPSAARPQAPTMVNLASPLTPMASASLDAVHERRSANMTFNDLAPPSAVLREAQNRAAEERVSESGAETIVPELALDDDDEPDPSNVPTALQRPPGRPRKPKPKPKPKGSSLGSTVALLSFSALLGIAVGTAVLLLMVLITWLVLG